jgi:hypothetical protein
MKVEFGELLQEAKEAELERRSRNAGTVVHPFKDKWTIRKVDTGAEAKLESEHLGHCMHTYADQVDAGTHHSFSLRDPKGFPHVSLEIRPTREPTVDWHGVRDAMGSSIFECPNCKKPVGRNGVCAKCGFNIHDLEGWVTGDERARDKIQQRAEQAKVTKPKEYNHDACPNCGSKKKEQESGNSRRWYCLNCYTYYDKSEHAEHGDYDRWNEEGEYVNRLAIPTETANTYQNAWKRLKPDLHQMGLLHHDMRDGQLPCPPKPHPPHAHV